MSQILLDFATLKKNLLVVLSLSVFLGFAFQTQAQESTTALVVEIQGLTVDQHAEIYRAFAERNDFELFRSCVPTGLLLFHSHVNFAPGTTTFFDSVQSIITTKVSNIGAMSATPLSADAFEQRCRQSRGGN